MKSVNKLTVIYHDRHVGTLSMTPDNRLCAFQYDKDWLANGFSISPLDLPLKPNLFIASLDRFWETSAFLPDNNKIKQDIPIPRICKSCYKIPKNLWQELRHLATSFQNLSTFFLICVFIFWREIPLSWRMPQKILQKFQPLRKRPVHRHSGWQIDALRSFNRTVLSFSRSQ